MTDLSLNSIPNRLLSSTPERGQPPTAWKLTFLLTLAAFLPRFFMALHLPTICVDGVGYIDTASALDRGDQGLIGPLYQLNTYPIVLAGLHKLGLSWEVAGKFWGVLCSTLVVPALFGWARREFNDRIAVVACLLYASHSELIEWSPETVRDPTYWLLFAWALYFSWRAVVEVRFRHFVVVGVLLPLCVLTRFEGAFLVLPIVGWSVVRFCTLRVSRLQLAAGLATALLIAPLSLITLNVAWLKHDSAAKLLYVEPLNRFASLTKTLADKPAAPAIQSVARSSPLSASVIGKTLRTIERGLTPVFALLLLGGVYFARRRVLACDQLPLLLYVVAVCGGIWIHQWYCDGSSSRYALTMVILGTRFAAPVCLQLSAVAATYFPAKLFGQRSGFALLGFVMLIGCADALSTQYESRVIKADLGRWIRRSYGENSRVLGLDDQLSLVGFYAESRATYLAASGDAEGLLQTIRAADPDVLLISRSLLSESVYQRLADPKTSLGLVPVRDVHLRPGMLVLGRESIMRR